MKRNWKKIWHTNPQIWYTNPHICTVWTVFIGDGTSLQCIVGEGPPAEARREVFPWNFSSFAVQGHGHLGLKFSWSFFALNVPAKQGRKLREKLRGKLREKLRPELPPSKTETSPKTSLCRNPLLNVSLFMVPDGDCNFNNSSKEWYRGIKNQRHRIWPGEGSTVQWKWSLPRPPLVV